MSTPLIDNFELKVNKPIDNRFVVGPNNFYTTRDSITNKYEGLRVWDTNVSSSFFWNGSIWIEENKSTGIVNGTINRIALFTATNTVSDSVITQDGNTIGIGRTPASGFGLAVNGSVTISGDDLYIGRTLRHVGNSASYFMFPFNNTIDLVTSDITRMRVIPNGDIGFGTTSPEEKVHIVGNIKVSNDNDGSPVTNTLDLTYPYNATATRRESYVILGRDSDVGYKYRVGSVSNSTYGNSGRFVIDELIDGNWERSLTKTSLSENGGDGDRYGIGTASPEEKVHVVGTIKSTNFISDKGYYSFKSPSTSNTNQGDWLKVFSISYSTFSTFNFTLKINGSGSQLNYGINTDVHISFKEQQSETRVYANICNYGETQIKPTDEFRIIKEITGTNQGRIYIYHKIVSTYTSCAYTILGKLDSTVNEYLTFESSANLSIGETAWTERIIISSDNYNPEPSQVKSNVTETSTSSPAFIQNKNPNRVESEDYELTPGDDNYVIVLNATDNDITVTVPTTGIPTDNYFVGFIQKGTNTVTINGSDIQPSGYTEVIEGEGHSAAIEIIEIDNVKTVFLSGSLKEEN